MIHEYLMQAVYFAPRGQKRLHELGAYIAQRYLSPEDLLVGLIGDTGAGKSLLIRGIFPGLELTSDDDGINVRPLPLLDDAATARFRSRTYHLDVRFETAFTPAYEVAEAVKKAVLHGRRVVVEHFEILYPLLGMNAEMLIGIGEEVIVTRPGVFGPEPDPIAKWVFESLKYRRMAHTAEDLTTMVLADLGIIKPEAHSDIKHGFVLEFREKPNLDLDDVEKRVQEIIARDEPICYHDEGHIKTGARIFPCTGPRLHVAHSGEVRGFRLLREYKWDPLQKLYTVAGLVGDDSVEFRPDQLSLLRATQPSPPRN